MKSGNGDRPFEWVREYSSGRAGERLPLGPGWTHNFDDYLEETEDGLTLWNSKGRELDFGHDLDEPDAQAFERGLRMEARRYNDVLQLTFLDTGEVQTFQRESEAVLKAQRAARRAGDDNHQRAWRLQSIADKRGNGVDLYYEPGKTGSRLTQVQDRRGWRFRLEYTGKQLSTVYLERPGATPRDPTQVLTGVRYTYHEVGGELAFVTDGDGGVTQYQYDGFHRLIRSISPLGARATWKYDEFHRCRLAKVGRNGYPRRFTYRSEDCVVVTGATFGRIFTFGSRGQLLEEKSLEGDFHETYTYDDDLLLTSKTDGCGNKWTYFYDNEGNKTREVDPLGNTTRWVYSKNQLTIRTSSGHVKHAWYNDFGELVRVWEKGGEDRYYTRDRQGRIEAIHAANCDGSDRGALVERRYYDANGLLVHREDARGLRSRYEHDALGYVVSRTDTFGDGAASRTWTYRHDCFGRVLEETFPDGSKDLYQYTASGLVTLHVDRQGRKTKSAYTRTGELLEETLPDGATWRYTWDGEDRLKEIQNNSLGTHSFEYDLSGRLVREWTFDKRQLEYTYNAAGHLTRIQRNDGSFRSIERDALGNAIEERTSDGAIIKFERDPEGHILTASISDEYSTIESEFERDELGRVVCERIGPTDDFAIYRTYDARGRIASRTVLGERTDYEYDAAGDIVAVMHTPKGGASVRTEIQRNIEGLEVRRAPRTLSQHEAQQAQFAINSEYTVLGQLAQRQVVVPEHGAVAPPRSGVAARYLQAPAAGWTTASHRSFEYDESDRLSLSLDRNWGLSRFTYSERGNLEVAQRERFVENFMHDEADGLDAKHASYDGQPVWGALPGPAADYSEDAEPPPMPGPPPGWLKLPGHASAITLAPGNRPVRHGQFEYQLDALGRRVSQRHRQTGAHVQFKWDCFDRLREVIRSDGYHVIYDYDAFGRRVRKRVGHPPPPKEKLLPIFGALFEEDGEERLREEEPFLVESQLALLWDGDELCAEQFGDVWQRVHVHAPTQRLPGAGFEPSYDPILQSQDGCVLQVVSDHLGTPKELVSTEGQVIWSAAHTAYGSICETWSPPSMASTVPVESPFRLRGQYYDQETELCSTRNRYFDPECGYWLSGDPIGTEGGYQLFGFNGAPTNVSDPLGLTTAGKNKAKKKPSAKSKQHDDRPPLTRHEAPAPKNKKLSSGKRMPKGTKEVRYVDKNGVTQATYYVDKDGRTIRAEVRIKSPDEYGKDGSRPTPAGMQDGDHRGHQSPERHAENQDAANVPENVLPEHGSSNLGPKKRWENQVPGWSKDKDDVTSVHEPQYEGNDPRPTGSKHWLEEPGPPPTGRQKVKGTDSGTIPNDESAKDYWLPWE
ncbi:MAG: RHS repeat-associated core domain-containing protein [Polyangiaceae bacterium]